MLDLKFIRENPDVVKKSLAIRKVQLDLDKLLRLDNQRRELLSKADSLRARKNKASDEIGKLIREKATPKDRIQEMKAISSEIKEIEKSLDDIESQLRQLLMLVPNIPHSSVPVGSDPQANRIIRTFGQVSRFDFPVRTHLELAQHLDIIDFPRAAKLAGSNFVLFKGLGAQLERALINFMLDLHTRKHNYVEVFPPFLVNRASMTGTGQLPKLEEDMYRLKDDDYFLIPTAEVPVTNIYRDEILNEQDLPVYFVAYSACFRREAGSYGKDTKGLVRVHQFDKVELVKFVREEDSYQELESLLKNAEEVLQLLELPYRVVLLSSEGLSFAASKCYDIEAYAPGIDVWLEVSSCSNFGDFQARRANIRYRKKGSKKLAYVHTLNGSGVALARTVVAIIENYQQPDGTVVIPRALRPYMNGREKIG
jgi:seryl-tRNA synthetase